MIDALSDVERERLGSAGARLFEQCLAGLDQRLETLEDKPEETALTTLRALWLCAAGDPVSAKAAASRALPALTAAQQTGLESLIAQRLEGTPLPHLTRRQQFMGVELLAGPEALIPRRETELLGRAAVERLQQAVGSRGAAVALDICTGSGNLAIGFAVNVPGSLVFAADLSEEAVALARRNVAHAKLQERVEVRHGDLLAPFDEPRFLGLVDVLVCNPPYISSAKVTTMHAEIAQHEPSLAFDGGPFGVRIIERLMREAPRFVRPGGWLVFEIGLGQGGAVRRRLAANRSYDEVLPFQDQRGDVRAIAARVGRT